MLRNYLVITNNPKVYKAWKEKYNVDYKEGRTYKEVLELSQAKIHQGCILETHPLSGSVKPNETPFRTVVVSIPKEENPKTDTQSLLIMEDSMATFNKFWKNEKTPNWTEEILDDFSEIDFNLISNVLVKLY